MAYGGQFLASWPPHNPLSTGNLLLLTLAGVPSHWVLEYMFLKGFFGYYGITRQCGSIARLFFGCSLAGIKRALIGAFMIMAYLVCVAFLLKFSGLTNTGFKWLAAPVIVNGLVFSLIGIIDGNAGGGYNSTVVAFSLLSLSLSFAAITTLLTIAWLGRSRRTLMLLATACERLDRIAAPALFSASMTLFAFATGCMQAFTFAPP